MKLTCQITVVRYIHRDFFRSVSPQSPAFYVHSCCFPRQTTPFSVDLQLFIAVTSSGFFSGEKAERAGWFKGGDESINPSPAERKREKRKAFSCNVHIFRLVVISSKFDVETIGAGEDELSWMWFRVLGCHVTKKKKPGCRCEAKENALKIEKKKELAKENVESHETISLYVINDASSNRWDPIINSAVCFAVYWISFRCPFHPLLGFISNVHQARVDLALTFSLLSLIFSTANKWL